jgi:hypothetical protein
MGLLSLALYMAILQMNHFQRDGLNVISWSKFSSQERRLSHRGDVLCAQNRENEEKQFIGAVRVKQNCV